MTFKRIIALLIILIFTAGTAFAEESVSVDADVPADISADMYTINNFLVYQPYKPKKNEKIFNEASIKINSVNPTVITNEAGGYLPGIRGTNQLVVYTGGYAIRTGTNEFGAEAIVEDNTVTELSGADSFIPKNGLVISGHGVAKNWINKNIKIGTKVYIDAVSNTLYVYTTSESYLFEAARKIDEAKAMVDYYKASSADYDFTVPNEYIKEAQDYLKKAGHDVENSKKYSEEAIKSANTALKSVVPYKNNEFKGVWVRPVETSEREIANSVKRIKEAGIDNIFIETYFHGRTIFPSKTMEKYGFVKQNEKFEGFDPLKAWIKYAHRNNIKVHIWFETFYAGIQRPEKNPGNILAVKPRWANKTKRNYKVSAPTPSISEHNGFFIDPANPEVHDFLIELLSEIIKDYKVDGINLDYIRYPQAVSVSDLNSWGYTDFARQEFKTIYGKDPVDIQIKDPLWLKWCEYRRNKITYFVSKVGALGRENGVYISAVIFPDRVAALTQKQQDWKAWSEKGYVNGFTPLFLTCNAKTLNALVTNVMKAKLPATDLFAGLFVTFMGGSEEDLIREIHETRKINANGVILFDYAHLDDRYIEALSERVFNEKDDKSPTRLRRIETTVPAQTQVVQPRQQVQQTKKRRFFRRNKN